MSPQRSGAQGLGADRLHHHLADDLAARGADPAAVHGRRGRPAVPRIRDHARGDHRHFGGGVADAGADAVRQAAEAVAARPARRSRQRRPLLPLVLACYASALTRRARPSDPDAARRARRPSCSPAISTSTIPKGFFPMQDTGVIQGVTQASQAISFDKMAMLQQQLAEVVLNDPDVESLSSFIGVDGSNVTLNSGRILINLKPHDKRKSSASEIIRRLQEETAGRRRHRAVHAAGAGSFHRHGGQRDAIPVHARNQDLATLQEWTPKVLERLGADSRRSSTSRAICSRTAARSSVDIDRATAARFGITPASIDNALYDAFGQRIISTIFTQSNQYRVILDIDPGDARLAEVAGRRSICPPRPRPRGRCRSAAISKLDVQTIAAADLASQAVSGDDDLLQPGARRFAGRAVDAINAALAGSRPAAELRGQLSRARRRRSSRRCRTKCSCCSPRSLTMYIVLGVLYESFIHPITILSTLPSAGIGALLALNAAGRGSRHHRRHRHRAADRHRQEERDHDDRLRAGGAARRGHERRAMRSTRPACCACGRF